MVNSDDFIKRLEYLLDYYSLSASGFADKIGVQRSSLSHLLSGRNKPSLDFILKINDIFQEVDLYWLLNGKENFLKSDNKAKSNSNLTNSKKDTYNSPIEEFKSQNNLFSNENEANVKNEVFENKINEKENTTFSSNEKNNSEIEKIVVFYKNGTFLSYNPK